MYLSSRGLNWAVGRGSGLSTVNDKWRKRLLPVTAALLLKKGVEVRLIQDGQEKEKHMHSKI